MASPREKFSDLMAKVAGTDAEPATVKFKAPKAAKKDKPAKAAKPAPKPAETVVEEPTPKPDGKRTYKEVEGKTDLSADAGMQELHPDVSVTHYPAKYLSVQIGPRYSKLVLKRDGYAAAMAFFRSPEAETILEAAEILGME